MCTLVWLSWGRPFVGCLRTGWVLKKLNIFILEVVVLISSANKILFKSVTKLRSLFKGDLLQKNFDNNDFAKGHNV
jgi:hypothetical protein